MSVTFFSVDVETSRLNPFEPDSFLLSLGAVAMDETGTVLDDFYVRIDRSAQLKAEWYRPEWTTNNDTLTFWREQDAAVRGEAWEDKTLPRLAGYMAAADFCNWVISFGANWEDRIFVANPATFDYSWLLSLFAEGEVDNPFHYRTLCLRSQAFGAQGSKDWHSFKHRSHKPHTPHHPLSDAMAQALDFRDMVAAGAS